MENEMILPSVAVGCHNEEDGQQEEHTSEPGCDTLAHGKTLHNNNSESLAYFRITGRVYWFVGSFARDAPCGFN